MIHPHTQLAPAGPSVGLGVFATRDIPWGTVVWTQDRFDQVFTRDHALGMDAAHGAVLAHYAHADADGNRILCWDAGRYVNHHCDPNLRGVGPWFMVARRHITAGEEITCDYAECNIDEALPCECGHVKCRERIHGSDLLSFYELWDAEAKLLAALARTVPQPLAPYYLDPEQAENWLAGRVPIPSFRDHCAFKSPAFVSSSPAAAPLSAAAPLPAVTPVRTERRVQ